MATAGNRDFCPPSRYPSISQIKRPRKRGRLNRYYTRAILSFFREERKKTRERERERERERTARNTLALFLCSLGLSLSRLLQAARASMRERRKKRARKARAGRYKAVAATSLAHQRTRGMKREREKRGLALKGSRGTRLILIF